MNRMLSGGTAGLALAATVAATVTALGTGTAHAAPQAACGTAAVFRTEIQWGGDTAPWHADADLRVVLRNRHTIADRTTAPAGTKLSWSGPNGKADITFAVKDTFTGTAQFPSEGPVGYRGTLARTGPAVCDPAATFRTEIQWGGDTAPWHADAALIALIKNRHTVVDKAGAPAGTELNWSGPNGKADITFTVKDTFTGTAQFPSEGPVGYRGKR